jgi:hypothetical protein
MSLESFEPPTYLYISLPRPCRLERLRDSDAPVKYMLQGLVQDRCTDFKHDAITLNEYRAHVQDRGDRILGIPQHGAKSHVILVARSRDESVAWVAELVKIEIKGNKVWYTLVSHPKMIPPSVVTNLGTSSYLLLHEATLFIDTTRNLEKVSSFLKTPPWG